MREAYGEPGGRQDRDVCPFVGTEPAKLTTPDAGASTGAARRRADRDAAVLAARVRMRLIEGERLQDRPLNRPGPRTRHGHEEKQQEHSTSHRMEATALLS